VHGAKLRGPLTPRQARRNRLLAAAANVERFERRKRDCPMAKINYHSTIKSIRGKMGGLRFSKRGQQGVVSAEPATPTKKRKISERELANQIRTKLGNIYAKGVQLSPEKQDSPSASPQGVHVTSLFKAFELIA
jgi:hypothetical protein